MAIYSQPCSVFPEWDWPERYQAGTAPESPGGSAHACSGHLVLFTEALGKRPARVLSLRLDTMVGTKHRSAAFLAGSKEPRFICLKWDFRCPGLRDKRTALTLTAGMDDLRNVFLEARFAYMYGCVVKHPGSRSGSGCGHEGCDTLYRLYEPAPGRAVCSLLLSPTCTHSPNTRAALLLLVLHCCSSCTAARPALQRALTTAFTVITNHKGKITADTMGH